MLSNMEYIRCSFANFHTHTHTHPQDAVDPRKEQTKQRAPAATKLDDSRQRRANH